MATFSVIHDGFLTRSRPNCKKMILLAGSFGRPEPGQLGMMDSSNTSFDIFNPQIPLRMDGFDTGADMSNFDVPATNVTTHLPGFDSIFMDALPTNSVGAAPKSQIPPVSDGSKLGAVVKNRQAQKRFRERQKAKKAELTDELSALRLELDQTRSELNDARARNSVFEKVLGVKESQMRNLQQVNTSTLQFQAINRNQKLLAGANCNLSIQRYASDVSAQVNMTSSDVSAIQSMQPASFIDEWKKVVNDLGNALVVIQSGSNVDNNEAHRQAEASMCRSLDRAGELCWVSALFNPNNIHSLLAVTLDDGISGSRAEDKSRWAAIANNLQLSPEQKNELVALRGIFISEIDKVKAERRQILKRFQDITVHEEFVSTQSEVKETMKASAASQALKSNVQQEHECHTQLIATVFKSIFNPMQMARVIVESYPFYPDMYAIAEAVDQAEGLSGMVDPSK